MWRAHRVQDERFASGVRAGRDAVVIGGAEELLEPSAGARSRRGCSGLLDLPRTAHVSEVSAEPLRETRKSQREPVAPALGCSAPTMRGTAKSTVSYGQSGISSRWALSVRTPGGADTAPGLLTIGSLRRARFAFCVKRRLWLFGLLTRKGSMMEEFWTNRSVLVTGASGFFGGWLVRELLNRDANVVALVRRNRADSQLLLAGYDKRVTVVTGEVYDKHLLETTLVGHDVDVIFHAAIGAGDVQATLAEPVECLRSTVESTWWLLDFLRRRRSKAVMVVCSSDKAYGAQPTPYRESQPLQPRHPQEVAKASQDLLTQSFGKAYDLNVAVTRCANFFGPYDFNFSRIIPYVSRCCAQAERPQLRSNGQFMRDFISVQEAALAHLMLARSLASRTELRGEVFNFSYEVQLTVMEIVDRILRIADSGLKPIIGNSVRLEIPNMWLSCDKARSVLGWRPQRTFDESLTTAVDWYLENTSSRRERGRTALSL